MNFILFYSAILYVVIYMITLHYNVAYLQCVPVGLNIRSNIVVYNVIPFDTNPGVNIRNNTIV